MRQRSEEHMLISQRRGAFAEEPHRISGAIKRVRDEAAGDCRTNRMQPIFQARRHAEVASATANGPKQVGFFASIKQILADKAVRLAVKALQPALKGYVNFARVYGTRDHPSDRPFKSDDLRAERPVTTETRSPILCTCL